MYSASEVAQTAPGLAGIVQSSTSQYLKPFRAQWAQQPAENEIQNHRNPPALSEEDINYQEEDLLSQTAIANQIEKNREADTIGNKKPTRKTATVTAKGKRSPSKKQTVKKQPLKKQTKAKILKKTKTNRARR